MSDLFPQTTNIPDNTKAQAPDKWGGDLSRSELFVRNISMKYLAMCVEVLIGLVMLPFNISHLGSSVYGLWMLAASITMYFSVLDLGYGVAQVKYIAKYRAMGDAEGLNQIVSTLFVLFTFIGLLVLILSAAVAFNLISFFNLSPEEAALGRNVLIIVSFYVAISFPFSVFGGVVNGFQRSHLNASVSILTSIVVAAVNVAVLLAGYGLVELVAAVTAVRTLAYIGYSSNAYKAFPDLSVGIRFVRKARLREVSGFSAFILLIDLANKINYSTDVPIIGAILGAASVAVWTVPQRLATTAQDLTTQVSGALFPLVVDYATLDDTERLRELFIQGTRLSLAMVIPLATTLVILSQPLIMFWVGPGFAESVPVLWILACAVIFRVGNSTATTLLKGAGDHTFLTIANLAIAVSNLALSVVLVHRIGLIGVAIGTLVPLAFVSVTVLFPRACKRVDISVIDALARGVFPALWPILPAGLILLVTRTLVTGNLFILAVQAGVSALAYIIVFLFLALRPAEREWYLRKIKSTLGFSGTQVK